jgi:hypothetical protein
MANGELKLIRNSTIYLKKQNIIGFIKKTKAKLVRPCRTYG